MFLDLVSISGVVTLKSVIIAKIRCGGAVVASLTIAQGLSSHLLLFKLASLLGSHLLGFCSSSHVFLRR